MKIFKKILILLTLSVCVFSMTACSSTNLSVDGYLWFKNSSNFDHSWKEVCTYDVSLVSKTNKSGTEIVNEDHPIVINAGTYTTVLETSTNLEIGDYYVYTTNFNLNFTCKEKDADGNTVENTYEETFVTTTKFQANLVPISTYKKYDSNHKPDHHYEYTINYSGSTANATLSETYNDGKYSDTQDFEFKKYNKNAYIDNDILLLIPRLFNVNDSFARDFRTIDVLSNKLHDMQMYAYLNDGNVDVKNLENYTLNGVNLKEQSEYVSCAHVEIAINDTFSGSPIECYYAQDRDTHRHRLIETFTRFGSNGYLKFHLKDVQVTGD